MKLFESIDEVSYDDSASIVAVLTGNRNLKNYIDKTFTSDPATLQMKFPELKEVLKYTSSRDRKIRAYSWESGINGNEMSFLQFQAGDKTKIIWNTKVSDLTDAGSLAFVYNYSYSSITSVKTKLGKTVYLLIYEMQFPRVHERQEIIDAYAIDHGKLEPVYFFRTTKHQLSSISYSHDGQGSIPDADSEIHLSDDKKTLYIPIVKDYYVTDKFLVYKFDGNNYVFDKNAK